MSTPTFIFETPSHRGEGLWNRFARVAVLLQEYILALRAGNRDPENDPLLRRALSIQQSAVEADSQVTITVLNTLGNLLERVGSWMKQGRGTHGLGAYKGKFGPESVQLAITRTNLAGIFLE